MRANRVAERFKGALSGVVFGYRPVPVSSPPSSASSGWKFCMAASSSECIEYPAWVLMSPSKWLFFKSRTNMCLLSSSAPRNVCRKAASNKG